jgi:hypothetical protein
MALITYEMETIGCSNMANCYRQTPKEIFVERKLSGGVFLF